MELVELRDYTIPRASVPLPGKKQFTVRGLCGDDIAYMVQNHLGPVTRALKMYQESREDILSSGNLNSFIMLLAKDFPALVAEVISAATDSLDDKTKDVARQLPITTQMVALNEIVRLTLEDAGGLKNLLAEMRDRLSGVASIAAEVSATARPENN